MTADDTVKIDELLARVHRGDGSALQHLKDLIRSFQRSQPSALSQPSDDAQWDLAIQRAAAQRATFAGHGEDQWRQWLLQRMSETTTPTATTEADFSENPSDKTLNLQHGETLLPTPPQRQARVPDSVPDSDWDRRLGSLPDRQRQVFRLRFENGKSIRQIAVEMQCPAVDVVSQLRQALKTLAVASTGGRPNDVDPPRQGADA